MMDFTINLFEDDDLTLLDFPWIHLKAIVNKMLSFDIDNLGKTKAVLQQHAGNF